MVYRTPLSLAHSREFSGQGEIRTPNNGGLSSARLPIAPLGQRHQSQRKTRDSNPHAPKGNRVSTATRPTVSGYLPNQTHSDPGWTRTIALLNVDQASSPLDYGIKQLNSVDPPGIEPGSFACKAGILPLNDRPNFFSAAEQRSTASDPGWS